MSKAVIATMMHKLQGTHRYTDIANEVNVSVTTVIRTSTKTVNFGNPPHLPTTLAIDEFRGNAGGHKFHIIVTNPKGRRVLDILPERSEISLFSHFTKFSFQERSKVRYLVMDMSEFFRSKMRKLFSNVTIIADRFHLVRTAIESTLSNFLSLVRVANLSEFNNLLRSFSSWYDEAFNAFLLPYSNGFTEGCNNKTKVLKRNSYGKVKVVHLKSFAFSILFNLFDFISATFDLAGITIYLYDIAIFEFCSCKANSKNCRYIIFSCNNCSMA